jgi:site-specific DNA-methyltransferase (adenine-specific)
VKVLPTLPENHYDALLTDPPSSISFMGQAWDSDRGGRAQWVNWLADVMRQALRCLKPGAHGLVWAIPRRSHWTALALEDAGFEVRDCIHHYFRSGFPKSLNVGLAIDAKLQVGKSNSRSLKVANECREGEGRLIPSGRNNGILGDVTGPRLLKNKPTTAQAKEWDGWGTGLKPAIEHWWLVRKPLSEKTVAANVLMWGTGALNIDASRIPLHSYKMDRQSYYQNWEERHESDFFTSMNAKGKRPVPKVPTQDWKAEYNGKPRPADPHPDSRYPSHFIVSEWGLLGEHSGFFHPPIYCPKARGCRGDGNDHPTVKPVELLKYFLTLLCRPGGNVLDCFAGSLSTAVACQELGLNFTGIEEEPRHCEIGTRRLVEGRKKNK